MQIINLLALSDRQIEQTNVDFVRYLYQNIDWSARLIGIKGSRGTGKTTLLWQRASMEHRKAPYGVYLSLDELFFSQHTLLDTVEELQKTGLQSLYLDEVHKYPHWAREIKLIYDRYPQLKVVFTGSSIIDISKEEGDLSRRALMYTLTGLSYREFLALEYKIKIKPISLNDITKSAIMKEFPTDFKPLERFNDYLQFGYYPFYRQSKEQYPQLLRQLVRTVVEYDMLELRDFDITNAKKMLRLLSIIASQAPFKPNVSKLARKTGIHRNTLNNYFQFLAKAKLIRLLFPKNYSIAALQKPEKIFLDNPNLLYAMADQPPNIGTVREHFALSQISVAHQIRQPKEDDFLVDGEILMEIGGKNKPAKKYSESVILVLDNLEFPVAGKVPLWLLGFLY